MDTPCLDRDFVRAVGAKSPSFFAKSGGVAVTAAHLAELKTFAENARLCLHRSPEALFHDMIIWEHPAGRYYRPHRHGDKDESWHLMEGRTAVFIFDDQGDVVETDVLEDGGVILGRVAAGVWHTLIPLTPVLYHESKPGPFLGDGDSLFPDWAPAGSDAGAAADYMARLLEMVM